MAIKNLEPVAVGERLPHLDLTAERGGAAIPLRRSGREGIVLLILHASGCAACDGYLRDLARIQDDVRDWDGRVVVVRTGTPLAHENGTESDPEHGFVTAADPEGILRQRLRVDIPAILIADQWGELHAVEMAGPEHEFLDPGEVVDWLRFIAIQCPECQGEAY